MLAITQNTTSTGGNLIAERTLVTRQDGLPALMAEDYDSFRERVLADEIEALTLIGE